MQFAAIWIIGGYTSFLAGKLDIGLNLKGYHMCWFDVTCIKWQCLLNIFLLHVATSSSPHILVIDIDATTNELSTFQLAIHVDIHYLAGMLYCIVQFNIQVPHF